MPSWIEVMSDVCTEQWSRVAGAQTKTSSMKWLASFVETHTLGRVKGRSASGLMSTWGVCCVRHSTYTPLGDHCRKEHPDVSRTKSLLEVKILRRTLDHPDRKITESLYIREKDLLWMKICCLGHYCSSPGWFVVHRHSFGCLFLLYFKVGVRMTYMTVLITSHVTPVLWWLGWSGKKGNMFVSVQADRQVFRIDRSPWNENTCVGRNSILMWHVSNYFWILYCYCDLTMVCDRKSIN